MGGVRLNRAAQCFYTVCVLSIFAAPVGAATSIATVGAAENLNRITIGGTVAPYAEVTLSAQAPGRVQYIAGEVGTRAALGGLLVALNSDELQARYKAAQADLNMAEANVRNSQVQYSRELWSPAGSSVQKMPGMMMPSMFDQMFTRHAATVMGMGLPGLERHADLYNQGTQVASAEAAQAQARSRFEALDAVLRDKQSIAPFDGVILERLVEVGDTVQPGQPSLRFAHTRYLRIEAEVPVRLLADLQVGMMVPARVDVMQNPIQARVALVEPVADPRRHTVRVKFDLPEGVPGGPGMYAEIMIPGPKSLDLSLPVIPKAAVVKHGSLPGVYVIGEHNRAELRMVRLGSELDGGMVTVLSGLRVGERIAVDPPPGISSGWSPATLALPFRQE